jgi:23S rRNA pseudouridine2605 synthase
MRRSPRAGSELRRIGLARALSKRGLCSRKVAAGLILAGKVTLDGRVVRDPEYPTIEASRIEVAGDEVRAAPRQYLMLNKPRGLVTSAQDEQARLTVYECFRDTPLPWLGPVGRLDKASEGLLLFSNDTEWAAALLDPARHLPRTYHVQVQGIPHADTLAALKSGVTTREGEHLAVIDVHVLRQGTRNTWLCCVLDEGRNRHLRRLCELLGFPVLRLVRVAIGDVVLGDLAKGHWRPLIEAELSALGVPFQPPPRV